MNGNGRRGHGDLEHEILAALAAADTALTPAQVRERLDARLAYNTVTTVLARLVDKGQVTREPAGRGYAYRPVRDRAQVTAFQMRRLLDDDTDRSAVLARFVGTLTPEDEALLVGLLGRAERDQP
ncbi:BlaI/MecI/CopY family transcriptional regulator [Micromonospora sp. CPCC 205711]|uniref:BlaI/MecI/CopY family transcriptional regulator n=1 Tax=Micromonospora sp. CPCC 205547 TaxID=3122400 RepID=UPI002FF3B739